MHAYYVHTHTRTHVHIHACALAHTQTHIIVTFIIKNLASYNRLADNTVACRIIHSTNDIQKLGENLNILHQWTKDWFMLLNI